MLAADRQLERFVVEHRVHWLDPLFVGLSWIGSYGAVWLVIGLVLALRWRRPWVFLLVLAAYALADLSSYGLREAIGRPRPFERYPLPKPLVPKPHSPSFPSGHAATSFACAAVLSSLAPRAAPLFFLLATLIACSRVYVGVHYPLDVLAGALLGLLLATALLLLAAVPRRSRREPQAG
jgi:undecaprenyl-diphosphatase